MKFEELLNLHYERLHNSNLKPKTIYCKKNAIKNLANALNDTEVAFITPYLIQQVIQQKINVNKTNIARRIYIEAYDIFYTAILHRLINDNPVLSIKRPKDEVKRSRLIFKHFIKIQKIATDKGNERFVNGMNIAIMTGQRRHDITTLSKENIWNEHLHIIQQKTGERIAIPLSLKLDVFDWTLGELLESINLNGGEYFYNNKGKQCKPYSLTHFFSEYRKKAGICKNLKNNRTPPSFSETRSLSERLYRAQKVDTQTLLGHIYGRTTDLYGDRRGLIEWRTLRV